MDGFTKGMLTVFSSVSYGMRRGGGGGGGGRVYGFSRDLRFLVVVMYSIFFSVAMEMIGSF
jgi:hypothetical protein